MKATTFSKQHLLTATAATLTGLFLVGCGGSAPAPVGDGAGKQASTVVSGSQDRPKSPTGQTKGGDCELTGTRSMDMVYVRPAVRSCGNDGTMDRPFGDLDRAMEHVKDSGTIVLSPGTYFAELKIDRNLTLLGPTDGGSATIAAPREKKDAVTLTIRSGATVVSGVNLVGGSLAVAVMPGASLDLRGSTVSRATEAGIAVMKGATLKLRRSKVQAGDSLGAIVATRARVELVDTRITGSGSLGLDAMDSVVTISGCFFEGNRGAALMLRGGTRAEVSDTTINGIAKHAASGLPGYGVRMLGEKTTATLRRVSVRSSHGAGLSAGQGAAMVADSCEVANLQGHGVELEGNATGSLPSNTLRGNGGYGAFVGCGAFQKVGLRGNSFEGNRLGPRNPCP